MQKRLECKVRGRVQMVMYRDFTMRKARKLGLVGTVKNNIDGTVSVVAEGEEESLHEFIPLLMKGSLLARVDAVSVIWKDATNKFTQFVIAYK